MGNRSCAAVLNRERQLMVRQRYKGEQIWTFLGGDIEDGETAEEAAIREVYEETNLRIEIVQPLLQGYNDRIQGMYYCFLGIVMGGELSMGTDPELPEQEQELQEVRWFQLDELPVTKEVQAVLPYIRNSGRMP
ncbi:NUDIX hydrolase [Paenibacillus piri]|nr:NUDIX hydrolase [Paenibacillus piri]